MANLYRVTPFMHVPDFEKAVWFFTEVLGFTLYFRTSNYAYVQRELMVVAPDGNLLVFGQDISKR